MTDDIRIGQWAFALSALLLGALSAGCSSSSSSGATSGCSTDTQCGAGRTCDLATRQCVAAVSAGAGGMAGAGGAGGAGGVGGASGSGGIRNDSVAADAACSVIPQAGCPNGHACLVANTTGATSCYIAGASQQSAACDSVYDCAPGLLCAYGQCRSICASAGDCGQKPYGSCYSYPTTTGATPYPGFGFCTLQCNPADPPNQAGDATFARCLDGDTCYTSDKGAQGTTECYQAGPNAPGASCKQGSDCVAGYVCLYDSSGSNGTCTPFCLMGKGCKKGTCQSFGTKKFVGAKSGLVEIGYCN